MGKKTKQITPYVLPPKKSSKTTTEKVLSVEFSSCKHDCDICPICKTGLKSTHP